MTRVHIAHHEPEGAAPLLAEVFYVDPAGEVDRTPVQRVPISPGVPVILNLRPGCVLTVREVPPEPAAARAVNQDS